MNAIQQKIILIMIIAVPLIDMTTAVTIQFPFSIGALVRTAMMIVIIAFLSSYYIQKGTLARLFFFGPFVFIFVTFIINYFLKHPFYIKDELQFLFKTGYLLCMIFLPLILKDMRKQTTS